MKVTIKYISDGADYEVYVGKQLIATCGTIPRAERIRSLLLGAEAALAHLKACKDTESDTADSGARAIELLEAGLFRKGKQQ